MVSQTQIQTSLENIYISPLEKCNFNCQLCYTKKTSSILSNRKILDFLKRYEQFVNLKSVIFCGGEVFTLPDFHQLINKLTGQSFFVTVITNGTVDRLLEIDSPQNCQLLVSLDGPKEIHDQNRGEGNFNKSIEFIKKASGLGFPVEIMFLITPASYYYKDTFPNLINRLTSLPVKINYITQKTFFYTQNHPLAAQKNFPGLTPGQIIDIKKNYSSIPPKKFGCYQLSLQSNGFLYGCCESTLPIGKITDQIENIIKNFRLSLETCQKCSQNCLGCCQPEFSCGYIKELGRKNCQEVIKLLN